MRAAGPQWQEDILGPDYQALALRVPARAAPTKEGTGRVAPTREGTGSPAKNSAAKNSATTAAGISDPAHADPTAAAYQEHVPVFYRATLVRHRPAARHEDDAPPPPAAKPAVLFIHGWSDYFYNTGLAEFFTSHGYSFYAVDLHNHGRSLTSHEMGGYVADLADYDAEILAAHAVIAQEHSGTSGAAAGNAPILLMGHSTGGLIATLWAHHHPGLVSHLILNSPWLEIQGGAAIRRAATPLVQLADLRPLMRMRVP
ncbi:MAG: alpha/beta fold hydrolase, partial [Specibacter sp.]